MRNPLHLLNGLNPRFLGKKGNCVGGVRLVVTRTSPAEAGEGAVQKMREGPSARLSGAESNHLKLRRQIAARGER